MIQEAELTEKNGNTKLLIKALLKTLGILYVVVSLGYFIVTNSTKGEASVRMSPAVLQRLEATFSDTAQNKERILVLETDIKNLKDIMTNYRTENREDHGIINSKLDGIAAQVRNIK